MFQNCHLAIKAYFENLALDRIQRKKLGQFSHIHEGNVLKFSVEMNIKWLPRCLCNHFFKYKLAARADPEESFSDDYLHYVQFIHFTEGAF